MVSAHTFGMYALAPLSGRFTDRYGSQPVILGGLGTLTFAGLLAAAAPGEGGPALLAALFLLGFGWNLCFVAGSNLLASGLALAERTRLAGRDRHHHLVGGCGREPRVGRDRRAGDVHGPRPAAGVPRDDPGVAADPPAAGDRAKPRDRQADAGLSR